MATRKPTVLINGVISNLPDTDTLSIPGDLQTDSVCSFSPAVGFDDADRFQTFLAANVGKSIFLTPGTYNWETPCIVPSNSVIIGSPDVTILSTIVPSGGVGDPLQSCFLSLLAPAGTATTLNSSVAIGAYTAQIVANTINVGDTVLLSKSGVDNVGQMLKVVAKSGVSTPWTLTFDAQIEFAMAGGSSIQSIDAPHNIHFIGNGMTITGTGSRAIEFSCSENCLVSGIRVVSTDGYFTSIVCSFDVAGRNNIFRDMYIDGYSNTLGFGAQACLALECNVNSRIEDSIVSGAVATSSACGIYLPTSKKCVVSNTTAAKCYDGMAVMYSGAADDESCQRCSFTDCQFVDNTNGGITILGGKNLQFTNVVCERNGYGGFVVANGIGSASEMQFTNCVGSSNTTVGFLLEGRSLQAVNCVAVSNGASGFQIANDGLAVTSIVELLNCSGTTNGGSAVYNNGIGSRVLCSNLTTKSNQGSGIRIDVNGYLLVNGWDSEDDGLSGVAGVWENSSSAGFLSIERAHVKNLTSTVFWSGVLAGTGTVTLSDYITEMAGGSGVKAVADIAAAGTFIGKNIKTIVTGGTLTYGVYAAHAVACKIFLDEHCDLSAAGTPYNPDAQALANSGFVRDGTVDFIIKQADKTTNSATGQSLTIQAQNETGTTSTGGTLVLQSGTGTSTHGSITISAGTTPLGSFILNSNTSQFTVHPSRSGFDFVATNTSQTLRFAATGGGGVVYFDTTTINFRDSTLDTAISYALNAVGTTTIAYGQNVTAASFTQTTRSGTGTNIGATMTIQAQAGQAQTGGAANNNGGHLVLASGARGTGGAGADAVSGTIQLQAGANLLGYYQFTDTGGDLRFILGPSRAYMVFAANATSQFWDFQATGSGGAVYFDTGTLVFRDQLAAQTISTTLISNSTTSIDVFGTVTAFFIRQTIRAGTGANDGADFTIAAQAGQAQTGVNDNNDGGDLILQSGAVGVGGSGELGASPGNVVIKVGTDTVGSFTSSSFSMPNAYTFNVTSGSLTLSGQDNVDIGANGDVVITTTILDVNASGQILLDSATDIFITAVGEAALTGNDAVLIQSASNTLTLDGYQVQITSLSGFGSISINGDKLGFFGTSPIAQATGPNTLDDNSGGTDDDQVKSLSGTYASDVGNIRDSFAACAGSINELRTILSSYGLTT